MGGKYYEQFETDFKKVFKEVLDAHGTAVLVNGQPLRVTWNSRNDMDARALPAEAHALSPDRMATAGRLGGEGLSTLETEMLRYFADTRRDPGGRALPFTGLRELVEAHRNFYYLTQRSVWWPQLSDWFDRAEKALLTAGM